MKRAGLTVGKRGGPKAPLGPRRRALERGMASRRVTARLLVLAGVFGLGLGTTVSALRTEPFGVVVADGRPERLKDFASYLGLACAAWSGSLARGGGTRFRPSMPT